MTITPPHQLTNLLSHFLTTVTPFHSSLIPFTPLCHTSCHLPHPPGGNLASLTMFNNCHTSMTAFTLPKWHSYVFSPPSYYMYILHTSLTTSQFSNNSHTSPSNFQTPHTLIIPTALRLPKHIPHDSHLFFFFFFSLFKLKYHQMGVWFTLIFQ